MIYMSCVATGFVSVILISLLAESLVVQADDKTAKQPATIYAEPTDKDRELAAVFTQAIKDQEKQMTQELMTLLGDGSERARKWAGLPASLAGDYKAVKALSGELKVSPRELAVARSTLEKLKVNLLSYQAAAAPRSYQIPRVKTGTFDLLLADGLSADAAAPAGLVVDMDMPYPKTEPVKPSPGKCTLAWSEEALYLYYVVNDNTPSAKQRDRDGEVYDDDCVELFIVTQNNPTKYWELNINTVGSIRDVTVEKQPGKWFGKLDETATLSGLKVNIQTHANSQGYTIVARVPWVDLMGPAAKPKTGDRFKFVVGFSDRIPNPTPDQRGQTYYSNIYTHVGYHDVWRYETMELVD